MHNNNNECDKTQFKRPVSWLMGRELLAGLKWIMAYTLMGDKQDPKDWMQPEEIRYHLERHDGKSPFWFDYIADSGDGMSAVYSVAYLAMSDLWLDAQNHVLLQDDNIGAQLLPRGEFLFVGGDTAYHIADTASLRQRFQIPFNCAYAALQQQGKQVDRRPIYAIPGNHDYYDALDGFNRQFCKPISDEHRTVLPAQANTFDPMEAQLTLHGFSRSQTASYVALKLPFNWQFWGLDTQQGKIDKRQLAFFISTYPQQAVVQELRASAEIFKAASHPTLSALAPKKLIVATPEPSTVFGKWADADGLAKTFTRLGLDACFLADTNKPLDASKCRLDISGDVHHYERYWGNTPAQPKPNYASVVAGGGGAFLHPSHTDLGQVPKQVVYPEPMVSHALATKALLLPQNILGGGYVWLAGGILAVLSLIAMTLSVSTFSVFFSPESAIPVASTVLDSIKSALDTRLITTTYGCCSRYFIADMAYIVILNILLAWQLWQVPKFFNQTLPGSDVPLKYAPHPDWRAGVKKFLQPIVQGFIPLLVLLTLSREQLPHSLLAAALIALFFLAGGLLFGLSRRFSDILIERERYCPVTLSKIIPLCLPRLLRISPLTSEAEPLWLFNSMAVIYIVFGFLNYGVYASSVISFDLLMIILWLLVALGLVLMAWLIPGKFTQQSTLFIGIGIWHALLQIWVPLGLMLYASWGMLLLVIVATFAVTVGAGWLWSRNWLGAKPDSLSLPEQKRLGFMLLASWISVGSALLWLIHGADVQALTVARLLAAFVVGAFFACVWFGWYLAVSLAFHGHNNEAGGGMRCEQYRHLIRFKLTENTLTGYVIGIDTPLTELAADPAQWKFRLVDVFTLHAK